MTVGAAAPLQEAVIPGLRFGQEYYNDLLATYTRKRDLFVEGLDAIGLQHTVPQGAYYILMDISEFGFDSDLEFCKCWPAMSAWALFRGPAFSGSRSTI